MSTVALDAGRLAQLRVFSDQELREIAHGAIEAIAEQLTRLERAIAAGDLINAADAAHRGRNETLLLGARELCSAFTALEDSARQGDLGGAGAADERARRVWPPTRAAIERIVDSHPQQATVAVANEDDITFARDTAREMATQIGFLGHELTLIATALSEVARNIVLHAVSGELTMHAIERDGRRGIWIRAVDHGPGINDLELALKDGYSTTHGLGIGLPSARRLMDEFELISDGRTGTTVTMTKWRT